MVFSGFCVDCVAWGGRAVGVQQPVSPRALVSLMALVAPWVAPWVMPRVGGTPKSFLVATLVASGGSVEDA